MLSKKDLEENIKKEASTVLWRVVLFVVYYILLIVIGIALFVGAIWVTFFIIQGLTTMTHINGRLIIWGFILWLAMWWFCISFAWYLVKPLFTIHKSSKDNRIEVKKSECPELFQMISEVAAATGNKMPKHVYLSPEVNACVFYNSTSFWSLFLPTRKNLMVGVGLLQNMSKDEVKAIISHEFGHFSQTTMKVGSVCFRLLLIIRDMIELAKEMQKEADKSRNSDESWEKFFHLASGPVSFITGKTIDFYNYIEKANRKLSRLMEFEADSVACSIVGTKPFVSSLCKLDTISNHFAIFEKTVANLICRKEYLGNFWEGYKIVDQILKEDEKDNLTYEKLLTAPYGDNVKYQSKITIKDGWNTHPSLAERIENALRFYDENLPVAMINAWSLIPETVLIKSGVERQQYIASHLDNPIQWHELTSINSDKYETWVKDQFEEYRTPNYAGPFCEKPVYSFQFPAEEKLDTLVENPFTEDNRNLILEYLQGISDYNTLHDLKSPDSGIKKFIYSGQVFEDASSPIERQKSYLDGLFAKIVEMDKNVFLYIYQHSKDQTGIKLIYWLMFYGNDCMNKLRPMYDTTNAIYEQADYYHSIGQQFSLREDVGNNLRHDIWTFLKGFDYEHIDDLCGTWVIDDKGKTVHDDLVTWNDFASAETPTTDASETLNLIVNVYQFVQYLFNFAKRKWDRRVVSLIYGKDNEFDHIESSDSDNTTDSEEGE